MKASLWSHMSYLAATIGVVACTGNVAELPADPAEPAPAPMPTTTPDAPDDQPATPLETNAASTYVSKVKNLMLGSSAEDAEVNAVEASPAALRTLVDEWMKRPEFEAKMRLFLRDAFQQGQIN